MYTTESNFDEKTLQKSKNRRVRWKVYVKLPLFGMPRLARCTKMILA